MEKTSEEEGSSYDYYFFWNSSTNPFSGVPIWTPYNLQENNYLQECYIKFKNGEKSIQPEVGNYIIDFKDMIQKFKSDEWRQRPVIREPKQIVPNVQRKKRLGSFSNLSDNNQEKINTIDKKLISEKKSLEFYKSQFITKNFCIIKENHVEYEILKNFDCLGEIAITDYETYIHNLKKEIQTLADIHGYNNPYEKEFVNKISKDNFYSTILKMFSAEDFLYKTVNDILRLSKSKNDLDSIKYFYNALLASFQKFSYENNKKLSLNKNDKIFVYKIINLSEYEDFYKKESTVRILNDFISTSLIKNNVLNLLSDDNILLEIEIDLSFYNYYLYMNNETSEFPLEEEILLASGSAIIFEKINEEYCEVLNSNIKIIRGSLLTLDMSGYLKYLRYDNTIKNFYLGSCDLVNQTNIIKILSETIKINSTIERLDLPFNNLGLHSEAVTILCKGIKENYSIKYLNLWDNNLGNNTQTMKELSEAIKDNKSIVCLNLENNNLGSNLQGLEFFCEAIKVNTSLERINLSKNNLGSSKEAMQLLGVSMKENSSISRVDLHNNNLGSNLDGLKFICDYLKVNKAIKVLNLWENNLGNNTDAMKYLSEALKENTSLKHLYLSSNNIGTNIEAIKYLSEAIKHNISICFLNLYNNDFQSNIEAFYILINALKLNNTLNFVNLEENNPTFNSKVSTLIDDMLKFKKSLGINY